MAMGYESVGDYVADCSGVAPWFVGKVFREFHGHETRLDLLAGAYLIQSENPGVPPARLWKRVVKLWLKGIKYSLGMTGSGAISADRRFAAVDADCDISAVSAAICDDYAQQQEQEQDRIAKLVIALLDALQQGLGSALAEGRTVEQAAEVCGIGKSTAYARIDRVREMLAA